MYRLEFDKVCKNTLEMTVYNAYVLTLMRDTFLTVYFYNIVFHLFTNVIQIH